MIDIAQLHRKSSSNKILGKFFATSSYRNAYAFLTEEGLGESEIVQKRKAYRGAVGVAKVHPFLVIEYLRWVDYTAYANYTRKKLDV